MFSLVRYNSASCELQHRETKDKLWNMLVFFLVNILGKHGFHMHPWSDWSQNYFPDVFCLLFSCCLCGISGRYPLTLTLSTKVLLSVLVTFSFNVSRTLIRYILRTWQPCSVYVWCNVDGNILLTPQKTGHKCFFCHAPIKRVRAWHEPVNPLVLQTILKMLWCLM